MIIQLEEFTGEAPRWHPRVLQQQYGQEAVLTKFDRRTLAPFFQIDTAFTATKSGVMQTIYRFGQDLDSDSSYWFHWDSAVDVIRSPANAVDERTYYFGDGAPKVTDETLALSGGGTNYPIGHYLLGLPRPSTVSVAVTGAATSEVPETRNYVYTYVTGWGEEGPASLPMGTPVDVKPGEVVTVDISAALPSGAYDIQFKRIYRTGSGEATTDYLLVAEVDAGDEEYEDTIPGGQLGETLVSESWEAPPETLTGAVLMPNGVILGWKDNEIWPSEPFIPHAFPPEYVLTADSTIVGIAVVGMTAVVITSGQPYLVAGVHPESFTMEKLDIPQAGVSRRAILAVDGGVIYASPDGLVHVTGGRGELVTRELYRREEWQALNPPSMHLAQHEGRLYCFYDNESLGGTPGGLLFDFFGQQQSVVRINQYFSAAYTDLRRDALFLCGEEQTLAGADQAVLGYGATRQAAQFDLSGIVGWGLSLQTGVQVSNGEGTVLGEMFGTAETAQRAQTSSGAGIAAVYGTSSGAQAAQRSNGAAHVVAGVDPETLPWVSGASRFWWHVTQSGGLDTALDGTGGEPGIGDVVRFVRSGASTDTYNMPFTGAQPAYRVLSGLQLPERVGAPNTSGGFSQTSIGGPIVPATTGFTLGIRFYVSTTAALGEWSGSLMVGGNDDSPATHSLVISRTHVSAYGSGALQVVTAAHGVSDMFTTAHSAVLVAAPLGGGMSSYTIYVDGASVASGTVATSSFSRDGFYGRLQTSLEKLVVVGRFFAEQAFTDSGDRDDIFAFLSNGSA